MFDTNWLIHDLGDAKCRIADIAGRHENQSVLIPKEVLRELDRLKTGGKDEATRYKVSFLLSFQVLFLYLFYFLVCFIFVVFNYFIFLLLVDIYTYIHMVDLI